MDGDSPLPEVAILMANSGGGHRSAARSLAEALDDRAHVSLLNLMDEYAPFPINTFSVTYGPWVNYAPWSYQLMYRMFASRRRVEFTERAAYPLVRRPLADVLAKANPDVVITVHPVQTYVPLRVLRELGNNAPFVTVVTDPVSPPAAWFCRDVDLCVVATEPARAVALSHGVPPDRVRVIGLPVRRAFAEASLQPKPEARARLGLDPERRLVLLSGGGAGIGRLLPMARALGQRLKTRSARAQLAIVAGHNRPLMQRLRSQTWPIPVTVLGFVEEMANWLAAADLLITKAGPGTLAEAACARVPVVITGYVPGQEEGNVTWTESHGAGIFIREPQRVAALVHDWLQPGNRTLEQMASSTQSIARCSASSEIADAALRLYHRSVAYV